MCEQRMKEIRALADQIPNFNRINKIEGGVIELYVEKGYAVSQVVFTDHEGRISVATSTLTEGTEFEYHTHDTNEVISIYEGVLTLIIKENEQEKEVVLKSGDVYVVPENVPHKAYCNEKTKILVQLMSSNKSLFNNGRIG